MIEGRFPVLSAVEAPFFSPCKEPMRLTVSSSTSGRHFFSINLAAGASYPDNPGADSRDFRKGVISGMDLGNLKGEGYGPGIVGVGVSVWVALGGTGEDVNVTVGGTGEDVNVGGTGVKVRVGGTGEDVNVAVGGIGVRLGVCVVVGGRNGVQEGAMVCVIVAVRVYVSVGVKVNVAVRILGVGEAPNVVDGMSSGVVVAIAVLVAVGVGVAFPGITTQASQPMQ